MGSSVKTAMPVFTAKAWAKFPPDGKSSVYKDPDDTLRDVDVHAPACAPGINSQLAPFPVDYSHLHPNRPFRYHKRIGKDAHFAPITISDYL
jgi:hypothetical protein